ncbi:MAG: RusA family crossover junction endodeoxyribonuclease [Chloroflexi bacterium]|nr:RusA family crossover junction endodeoxyribonuclease [Chloroflexota bacterium]
MPFTMLFAERPRSLQAKHKQGYQARLQGQARTSMPANQLLDGEVYARITWFHSEKTQSDIDNIVKPILDALNGVVYADDRQIVKCLSERVDTTRDFALSAPPGPADVYQELIGLLSNEQIKHILYIEIGQLSSRRIVFGPIDEEYL